MVAKLKSITKRIHWSLPLRAIAIGIAWISLSFPWFCAVAFIIYAVPFFHVGRFFLVFISTLIMAWMLPTGLLGAVIVGMLFLLLLGIKDLLILARISAYETLILFLIIGLFFFSFWQASTWQETWRFGVFLLPIGASFFLSRGFFRYLRGDQPEERRAPISSETGVAFVMVLLLLQCASILLFLPVDFLYQGAIIGVFFVCLLEVAIEQYVGTLSWRNLFFYGAAFFASTVFILASIEWGL